MSSDHNQDNTDNKHPAINVTTHNQDKTASADKADTKDTTNSAPSKTEQAPNNNEEVREINGYENKQDPTKHGDWSIDGRCYDF